MQFNPHGARTAQIKEAFTGRLLQLPVYQENNPAIQALGNQATGWPQRLIHVCPPEKDVRKKGYVYIGNRGLQGGGTVGIKEIKTPTLEDAIRQGNVEQAIQLISDPQSDPYAFLQPPTATLQTPAILQAINPPP